MSFYIERSTAKGTIYSSISTDNYKAAEILVNNMNAKIKDVDQYWRITAINV